MSSESSLSSTLANGLRKLVGAGGAKAPAYRMIDVTLKARLDLSPSLARLVFTGAEVAHTRLLGPDQRIKLFFPSADGRLPALPKNGAWQAARRSLNDSQRPPMRTYTLRALRPELLELDVDFVLHGVTGPASAWATNAKPGDRLQMLVPNLDYAADPGGYEWQPPADIRQILLIGDETALPAIAGILEQLADQREEVQVQAFIEVPYETDCIELPCHPSTELNWLPREILRSAHGEAMVHAARELARLPAAKGTGARVKPLENIDVEQQILWERARPADNNFYAWVAGESGAVMAIRRHLIKERGLDRQALTLMGYWREGRTFE